MLQYKHASTQLETKFGSFEFHCFSWGAHEEDNLLCLAKNPLGAEPLVRVQSACYTAEIFRSLDCDCHEQLQESLTAIQACGGILVYMLCDGRGAGLLKKVQGLELGRTRGLDTAEAYNELGLPPDPREYSRVAQILSHLGAKKVRLLTNNPRKVESLKEHGIEVQRESLEIAATENSAEYLKTKAVKMGHLLEQFQHRNEGT